ncbi:class II aldolase/adducin head domain-containing protein [Skeletonema marinoi]|uniref:Class II aldolase/adducin head domain-containing protein n=1 Tax=Skeletonema marinoi TaxID=267567 RepID=A0AAD8XVU7_9STRA|nr:class II aldolase/adducin head domain-containing protein [Skeletonema marinoi]
MQTSPLASSGTFLAACVLISLSTHVEAFVLSSRAHHYHHHNSSSSSLSSTKSPPIITNEEVSCLNTYPSIPSDLERCFTEREWEQRCSLAVSYRIAYLHDWHENIFNHITLKVDGSDSEPGGPYFLLNDFGIGFDEITASNLLKVNLDGMIIQQSIPADRREINPDKGRVFKPGYVLHSAIHAARHDVHAIWHGILPLSQEASYVLKKGLSFHPFEGSANDESEQPRLVANLGPTNQFLMLEDHGPIVACPTIEEAFHGMYFLTRACKYQMKSFAAVGGDLSRINIPDDESKMRLCDV